MLAEALVRRGNEVVVASTKADPGVCEKDVNGVRVYYVGLRNVYWQIEEGKSVWLKPFWHILDSYNPWMARALSEILDAEQPDVVHAHNLGGFTVAAWRAAEQRAIPLVHTLRDYHLLCPRNMYRRGRNCDVQCWQCRPFALPRRKMSRAVDAVVGISRFILKRHLKFGYFKEAGIRKVVYNPHPVRPGKAARKKHERGGRLRVGFLGRLNKMKGIERLLRAVAQRGDEVVLHVGGEGEEDAVRRLKAKYSQSHIHFLGFVDTSSFFEGVDLLVVPSHWHEPFGRVVIEAYAHGVPVIAASSGGLPEIVEEGRTGLLFAPDQSGHLEQQIEWVCQHPDELAYMKREACKEAAKYNLDHHVQQYASVYEGVTGSNQVFSR